MNSEKPYEPPLIVNPDGPTLLDTASECRPVILPRGMLGSNLSSSNSGL
jgi:hypothetical protein